MHPGDNVATLLADAEAGQVKLIPGGLTVPLNQPVALGHKVALADIAAGASVVKYGIRIGLATRNIRRGDWVHLHNCASLVDERAATLDVESGRPKDTPYE